MFICLPQSSVRLSVMVDLPPLWQMQLPHSTHIHSEGCICIKYFNYGGHAEVMHINSVWKWIYFINGISSEGQRSANTPGLRRHIFFFNCCASHCQGHCLSFFFPSLSVCHPLWKLLAGPWQMSWIISFGFGWMKCVCMCMFVHLCGDLIFMLCQVWRAYLIYDIFTVKEKNRFLERDSEKERCYK